MTKKQNWVVIGLFLVLIFGLTAATILKPDTEFSEKENRVLAPNAAAERGQLLQR